MPRIPNPQAHSYYPNSVEAMWHQFAELVWVVTACYTALQNGKTQNLRTLVLSYYHLLHFIIVYYGFWEIGTCVLVLSMFFGFVLPARVGWQVTDGLDASTRKLFRPMGLALDTTRLLSPVMPLTPC